ncbi:hypothetical protein C3Y91_21230 [Rhizobium sp. UPM1133]|nr:hypothetical protein [Rhizobium ruizarguesonis]
MPAIPAPVLIVAKTIGVIAILSQANAFPRDLPTPVERVLRLGELGPCECGGSCRGILYPCPAPAKKR